MRWPLEAQMIAQRLALVLLPEQSALHEDRHDLVDESLEGPRRIGAHDRKAVAGTALEPGFEIVGDLRGRSHEDAMARADGGVVAQLADGHVAAAGDGLK